MGFTYPPGGPLECARGSGKEETPPRQEGGGFEGTFGDPAAQLVLVVKNSPANVGDIRDEGSVPGSGRSPGGGYGNPLQDCCLENPIDPVALAGSNPEGRKESDSTKAT